MVLQLPVQALRYNILNTAGEINTLMVQSENYRTGNN